MWRKKPTLKDLLPPPICPAHGQYSMIASAHDDPGRPSPYLIEICLKAIEAARHIDLSSLSKRLPSPPYFPDIWPGEHYRLLGAFIKILQPKVVIEIGTFTGLSALSMSPFLPPGGRLITYDIQPWNSYPNTAFQKGDFSGGHLEQRVGDLSSPPFFISQAPLLKQADWIFIDASHDGILEKTLLDSLAALPLEKPPLVLFDDIRIWTMLKMWREISYPKLDLTSFGHWSGTGLVHLIPFMRTNS